MNRFTLLIFALLAASSMWAEGLSGHCGSALDWTLTTDDGQMAITGTGAMTEYKQYFLVPWTINRASVRSVTINEGVTSISQNAFYGCTALREITIPAGITKLGANAFYGCTDLSAFVLPETLTRIGKAAMYGCTSLEKVNIPASVTKIEKSAFYGCTGLLEIDCYLDEPIAIDASVFYGLSKSCRLIVNPGTKALWKSAAVWKNFTIVERK